jgi:hypothetical protein
LLKTNPAPLRDVGPYQDNLWPLDKAPKNVYVAAPLTDQAVAARFADSLSRAGLTVVSRWLFNDFSARPRALDWRNYVRYEVEWGANDLADLRMADTLVVLANGPSTSGGYHVELGYFLGANRTNIVVVGERRNVFFWHESIRYASTLAGLPSWLASGEHGRRQP